MAKTYFIEGSTTGGWERSATATSLREAKRIAADFRAAYEPTSGSRVSVSNGQFDDPQAINWAGSESGKWVRVL